VSDLDSTSGRKVKISVTVFGKIYTVTSTVKAASPAAKADRTSRIWGRRSEYTTGYVDGRMRAVLTPRTVTTELQHTRGLVDKKMSKAY